MVKQTKNYFLNESEQLVSKIVLSILVNFILFIGVCFLYYEVKFSSGTKLMILYAAIVASYLTAICLHTFIFRKNPLKKHRWIYFLITAIGLIPHTWSFLLCFLL